jgi:[glutamine synthetase] adenylyltransferase / [glutamine synthetase]-adenylyl-L-tyrosine phosphorylase
VQTMAFAPKLAADLARRPALLDAMLTPRFRAPAHLDMRGERAELLTVQLRGVDGFEGRINAARRFHREEAFRVGYQLLRGVIRATEAGQAYADLADVCVAAMAEAAADEVFKRFGGALGRWSVVGLGKFGGRELTATSDLDLMVIYDPSGTSDDALATRFVQRLVSALNAQTEEGALYEVDMQLRPSGRAGPVAVRLPAFEAYYQGDADPPARRRGRCRVGGRNPPHRGGGDCAEGGGSQPDVRRRRHARQDGARAPRADALGRQARPRRVGRYRVSRAARHPVDRG